MAPRIRIPESVKRAGKAIKKGTVFVWKNIPTVKRKKETELRREMKVRGKLFAQTLQVAVQMGKDVFDRNEEIAQRFVDRKTTEPPAICVKVKRLIALKKELLRVKPDHPAYPSRLDEYEGIVDYIRTRAREPSLHDIHSPSGARHRFAEKMAALMALKQMGYKNLVLSQKIFEKMKKHELKVHSTNLYLVGDGGWTGQKTQKETHSQNLAALRWILPGKRERFLQLFQQNYHDLMYPPPQ